MKILQLNTWSARIGQSVIDLLQEEDADLVCLQEVLSLESNMPSMLGVPLEGMLEELDYKNVFYSPVFNFRIMNRVGLWGNCIFSKRPFLSKEAMFTNLKFVEDFNFDEHDYNIRNFQHTVVKMNGKDLNVLNHHGHQIPEHKDGDASTMRQMNTIAKYLDELTGPVVLAGDFNLSPHSESLKIINGRLTNLPLKYRLKTTRTLLTHKTEVCDYLFVSKDITVNDFYASKKLVSDHLALILDFDI